MTQLIIEIMTLIDTLFAAIAANPDPKQSDNDFDFLMERFEIMTDWLKSEAMYSLRIKAAKSRLVGDKWSREDYQWKRESIDDRRASSHEAMLAACGQLNKMCNTYNVKHIAPEADASISEKEKYAAAVVVGEFMSANKYDVTDINSVLELIAKKGGELK